MPRLRFDIITRARAFIEDWRGGRTSWEHWNEATDRARELFARLVGVPVERVAAGSTASTFVGVLAAAVPDGARVVVPEIDFASLLFPFLVHEQRLDVVTVPLHRLADAVDELTDVVALSAVQSSSGAVADLDAVLRAASANEALKIVRRQPGPRLDALDPARATPSSAPPTNRPCRLRLRPSWSCPSVCRSDGPLLERLVRGADASPRPTTAGR